MRRSLPHYHRGTAHRAHHPEESDRERPPGDTATGTIPAHDPATYRVVPSGSAPLDQDRVQSLLAAEWERFTKTTPGSGTHHERALGSLPLGVTSSFQHWDPYPIAIVSGDGAWLTDVDGRRVLDLSMGFGAMLAGHLNPTVVARSSKHSTPARCS